MSEESTGYQTASFKLENKGWIARYLLDNSPLGTYFNLLNCESRVEGSISSAYGRTVITTQEGQNNVPIPNPDVHTLGRLKGLSGTFRYAGAGPNIYRRSGDVPGLYTRINGFTPLSGDRFTMLSYRPDVSSYPYEFFADSAAMLKDNGTMATTQKWGGFAPPIPVTMQAGAPLSVIIEDFELNAGFTFSPGDSPSINTRVNTTLGTSITVVNPVIGEVTPASMVNILPGMLLIVDTGLSQETVIVMAITALTFTAQFTQTHLASAPVVSKSLEYSVGTNSTGIINKNFTTSLDAFGVIPVSDDDVINVYIQVDNPLNLDTIYLGFDVSDGTFTKDYYTKGIAAADIQAATQAEQAALAALQQRVFDRASGKIDIRGPKAQGLGSFGDILPPDDPTLTQIRPEILNTGLNVWSRIQIRRGEFQPVGLAGSPGHTWADVVRFSFNIKTNENGGVTINFDDLYLFGGYGPDVFGGIGYDYRYIGYNADDGTKSNPSPIIIQDNLVYPERQPIMLTWAALTDPQWTHYRIYRRGGTLSTTWYMIAELPIGTLSYTDVIDDSTALGGEQIEIDNDPPVTSALPMQVITTLGTVVSAGLTQVVTPGSMTNIFANQIITVEPNTPNEEQVVVQSITTTQFTAFFQYAHDSTVVIKAFSRIGQNCNLGTIAFDTAWLAGDPNNPNTLYYSKRFRPQSFPPEFSIEIGVPSDPITAVIFYRNVLYVGTESTWYQILGAETSNASPPIPYPTGSRHGLRASFGWAIGEGMLMFQSDDGIYNFTGMQAVWMSEPIDWIWKGKALGPVVPLDTTRKQDTITAFFNNEFFFSYVGTDGNRHRAIFHAGYKRWRNDDAPANSMIVEDDIPDLVYGDTAGMIYIDRTGNYLSNGWVNGVLNSGAMVINLQTGSFDLGLPKNDKVWNEFTVDINTGGVALTLTLIFNNGDLPQLPDIVLGTVNSHVRDQFQFNINSGKGIAARTVCLKISGALGSDTAINFYQVHIRAFVEAEYRESYDSYWADLGEESWKFVKQFFVEYNAPSPISFSVYTEGNITTPAYTFTLPATSGRFARKVRFPAVKAKLWRFVGTSAQPFQFYADRTAWEVKTVTENKGYIRVPMVT